MPGTRPGCAAGGRPGSSISRPTGPTTSMLPRGSSWSSVGGRHVLGIGVGVLGVRDRRAVELVVAIVFAWVFHILFGHEGRPSRPDRARASRRGNGARRRTRDRAEARRAGGAHPRDRKRAGPPAAARGRAADP